MPGGIDELLNLPILALTHSKTSLSPSLKPSFNSSTASPTKFSNDFFAILWNSGNSKLPSSPWGPQIISKALQMCLTIISSIAKSGSNPSWILYSTPSLERI